MFIVKVSSSFLCYEIETHNHLLQVLVYKGTVAGNSLLFLACHYSERYFLEGSNRYCWNPIMYIVVHQELMMYIITISAMMS